MNICTMIYKIFNYWKMTILRCTNQSCIILSMNIDTLIKKMFN